MDKTTAKWAYDSEIDFTSPKRSVHTIFLHCSASDVKTHDDISVMKRWHTVDNGWSRVGYHFFINKNGDIQEGCPIEKIPIAQKGHNTGSIAICLHGLKKSKFTNQQFASVILLCKAIVGSYDKKIRIRGHKEVSAKSCPVFDYKTTLGLNAEGYYVAESEKAKTQAAQTPETPKTVVNVSNKAMPIRLMQSGSHVTALQSILIKLGYVCDADGDFGKNTATQVIAFQRAKGLSSDGVVGAKSLNAMFSSDNVLLKKSNNGTDVRVLQLLLAMYGENVMHDGVLGLGAARALKNQQGLLGLTADGVFGKNTRKKMIG